MSKCKNGGCYTATAKDIENYINSKLSLRYKTHKTSVWKLAERHKKANLLICLFYCSEKVTKPFQEECHDCFVAFAVNQFQNSVETCCSVVPKSTVL